MELSCRKKLSPLLRRKTSKHHGDFYSLNWLPSFTATENRRESPKKYVEIKIFLMLPYLLRTLKFNQYKKSDKVPFVIYADLEYLIEKIDG